MLPPDLALAGVRGSGVGGGVKNDSRNKNTAYEKEGASQQQARAPADLFQKFTPQKQHEFLEPQTI